jgi:cAMP-dependent protein kinase regulator
MSDEDASYNSDLPPESSEDEGDSSASTAPPPPMRGRRQGVSAEISQGSQEDQKPIASHAKTPADSHFLLSCMSSNSLFQHLPPASMDTVVSAFFLTEKQDGDVVMQQGADGDNFYVIQEGSVKILVNGNQVATKGAGGSFGELALMYNAPRSATVVCDGSAKLWALDRSSFQGIMRVTESGRNSTVGIPSAHISVAMPRGRLFPSAMHLALSVLNLVYFQVSEFLRQIDLFSGLSKQDLSNIVDAVKERSYKDGEYMFRQGDPGEDFFIISKGSVTVTKAHAPGAQEMPVAELSVGKFFGELALSTNMPRAASVVANGDCSCFTLDRGAFERLLGPVSEVLAREKLNYAQQDIATLREQVRTLHAELAAAQASSVSSESFSVFFVSLNPHQIQSLLEEPLSINIPAGTSEALQQSVQVLKSNYANSQEQLKLLVERMNACKDTCKSLSATLFQ